MIRLRLTEVYGRDLAEKMIPFRHEDAYPFKKGHAETITDAELKEMGSGFVEMLDADDALKVDKSLIYKAIRVDRLSFNILRTHGEEYVNALYGDKWRELKKD